MNLESNVDTPSSPSSVGRTSEIIIEDRAVQLATHGPLLTRVLGQPLILCLAAAALIAPAAVNDSHSGGDGGA